MLRVSDETRDRVRKLGQEDFAGASAEETIKRLLEEHWRAAAVAAVRRFRESDPRGWADYVAEADSLSSSDAPITDEWADGPA